MDCPDCKAGRQCQKCHAAYMRSYRATVKPRAIRRARRDGIEACRTVIVQVFRQLGTREMNGLTAAELAQVQRVD